MQQHPDVAIIGAGIAGLRAAQTLQGAGRRVVVLEKSRGFGGRAASRSHEGARLDYGAQYFTARSASFVEQVAAWEASGVVTRWPGGIWTARSDGVACPPAAEAHPRFIAPAGMNALGKELSSGLEVRREAEVKGVERGADGWTLSFKQDLPALTARSLLITAPAPQALALLAHQELEAGALAAAQRIIFAPCFTLMAAFDGAAAPPWPALRPDADATLGFLAHDASKRPQPHPTTLVLQATPAWTRAHFDHEPDEVARALLDAAAAFWPPARAPLWTRLHRWRYAQPEVLHPKPWLALAPGLLLAGDAFSDDSGAGSRIEGAYRSGEMAAEALLTG